MSSLSPAQVTALDLASQGLLQAQIARRLGKSLGATMTLMARARRKLNADTTPQAVRTCIELGIIVAEIPRCQVCFPDRVGEPPPRIRLKLDACPYRDRHPERMFL